MNSLPCYSKFYLERVGFEEKVNMRQNLRYDENLLGRNMAKLNISVDSLYCSRKHCSIKVSKNVVTVKDLNSSNGTTINKVNLKGNTGNVFENDIIGIVGGDRDLLQFDGNFGLLAYRLCKYNSNNLPTIEIEDDDPIEIEDDTVPYAGKDDTDATIHDDTDCEKADKIAYGNISKPIELEVAAVEDALSTKIDNINSKFNDSDPQSEKYVYPLSSQIIANKSQPYRLKQDQNKCINTKKVKKRNKRNHEAIIIDAKTIKKNAGKFIGDKNDHKLTEVVKKVKERMPIRRTPEILPAKPLEVSQRNIPETNAKSKKSASKTLTINKKGKYAKDERNADTFIGDKNDDNLTEVVKKVKERMPIRRSPEILPAKPLQVTQQNIPQRNAKSKKSASKTLPINQKRKDAKEVPKKSNVRDETTYKPKRTSKASKTILSDIRKTKMTDQELKRTCVIGNDLVATADKNSQVSNQRPTRTIKQKIQK